MIIINKSRYLKYKNLKFRCALGKGGIKIKKREGDNITPKGSYKIVKVYYRKDRIKKISTRITCNNIKRDMGWCDDPKSKKYNKLIKLPTQYNHEKLYRKDNLYDLILVLNFNVNPIVKNKGSAIFIHVARKKYKPTKGCIGLKKNNLIKIISLIPIGIKIKIN